MNKYFSFTICLYKYLDASLRQMIKAVLKYLLPLIILLVSGYRPLSAHAAKESASYASLEKIAEPETITFRASQFEEATVFNTSSSGSAKENHRKLITAEYEIEEDESLSLKAFLDSANYIAAILYAFICGYLFRFLSKYFAHSKYLAHFSAYRWHLNLQVIRV
ncbi:hypothetical protein MKJ04_21430 [Pontibacter sp. E15-1]|uniref:hypothetical protein n=1 Tax=Pontibacter sp. E15-1 TaxID=2919918 RepID=UPI001F502B83|nr:hypothetical protein [Pontibacter sp. E15-1]MCJ8167417.1 hypothetical protein [Pontibacter sp. E15-1]